MEEEGSVCENDDDGDDGAYCIDTDKPDRERRDVEGWEGEQRKG